MGIVDYAKLVKVSEQRLMKNAKISAPNKKYIKDFLLSYDVSLARKNIFLKQISKLLEATKDIKKDMQNPKLINKIFYDLRSKLSPPYYGTVVSCSLRFVRWLNDGDKPAGFKDVKNIAKSKQKRNLTPSDMLSWEDGTSMAAATNSVQMKAVIMVQLSSGFRPGEFMDLKYGDIEQKRSYLVAHVDGKTGKRSVIIDKGSPYLSQWLSVHPSKQAKDPLWVMEFSKNKQVSYIIQEYKYPALTKRVREIAIKSGVATIKNNKLSRPLDFYTFRHSCAVLLGKWGVSAEVRAKNMGHSITVHLQTYGRFNIDDDLDMYDQANGVKRNEHEASVNIPCKICHAINSAGTKHCTTCNTPLTLEVALKSEQDTKEQLDTLQDQMKKLQLAIDLISIKEKK